MFIKSGDSKYHPRDGETLDPQKLNANFRDAAQKIRYVQSLKYTYSVMQFDLIGVDFSKPSEERRFIIRPPSDCEIVGCHLSAVGLTGDQSVTARWLSPADLTAGGGLSGQIALVSASSTGGAGTASPVASNVVLPDGGETVSWDYVTIENNPSFATSEDITQRVVRLSANNNYVIEMTSSDSTLVLNSAKPASLTLWMRTNRGSFEGWDMIELLDGSNIPYVTPPAGGDPRGIGNIIDDLSAQAALAISASNSETHRCDVVRVGSPIDVAAAVDDLSNDLSQRIPRPPKVLDNAPYATAPDSLKTNTEWGLHRVDFVMVSSDAAFGAGYNPALELLSDGVIAPPAAGTNFYKISDPTVSAFKEVYIQGPTADGSGAGLEDQIHSETAGTNPLDPAKDLHFSPAMTSATENVASVYMYIWYKLNT